MSSCKIVNIESDSQQLRIDLRFVNYYGNGAWVRIYPETFIRPAGSDLHLPLLKAEDIPIAPEKLFFKRAGDVLHFSLFFPPLTEGINEFDLIEDEEDEDTFNFFGLLINQKPILMSTHSTTVLKNIEKIALELKGDRKTPKSFTEELNRLDEALKELADFLKLSKEESAILSLAIYNSVTTDCFCLTEIKNHCHFYPFDFHQIKIAIKSLVKKGWLQKLGSVGMHRSMRRIEEKEYAVSSSVMESLYKNECPVVRKKEPDVYLVSEMLYKCFREFVNHGMDEDEKNSTINEYEEEFMEINPFKLANELELNSQERTILYYLVTKTLMSEAQVEVEALLYNLFKSHSEKIQVKKLLSEGKTILMKEKIIEYVPEDFKTDKIIRLTESGIKKIFGEDAFFLSKDDGFSSGLCKLIKYESILEKDLYYNEQEKRSVQTISEFLKEEKFNEIITRLEENKMRPGLTILLYGYPGTGKTETIYQLARQTKRNILLVNISEIRDKWVGESEKRLKSVFETYRNSLTHFDHLPILVFNESDALIGKRIQVNTSVDQMNNAMQNILLQELEDFKGILMATTNLTSNLDEAFERRFLFKVKYCKPSLEAKSAIWRDKLKFLTEEDALCLAEQFDFSGGQIENISRKVFLDSVLLGKIFSLKETMSYCEEEILSNRSSKRIGF